MEAERANPFGSKLPIEKLKESEEGYAMFMSKEEFIVKDFDKITIAGKDFAHGEFIVIEGADSSYIHEYYHYHKGYFLSIIYSYNANDDKKIASDFISSIKKIK